VEPEDTGQGNSQGESTGGNPAWQEFLAFVPEDQHSQAQEVLSKWDQGVQQRFQARAEELEPFKPFIEQKVDPQTLQAGLQLYEALNTRPQDLFKSMADTFGLETAQQILGITPQATEPAGSKEDEDDPFKGIDEHPVIKELRENFNNLATVLVGERERSEIQAQEDLIADEIAGVSEKLGRELKPFEEEHLILSMLNGANIDQAFNNLQGYLKEIGVVQDAPPAPTVLGSNGGVPSAPVDPRKMTDSQRQHSAIDLLKNLNAADRQG